MNSVGECYVNNQSVSQEKKIQFRFPRRICLLSEENPFVHPAGSTQYTGSIVDALARGGATMSLLVMRRMRWHHLRLKNIPLCQYVKPFERMVFRDAVYWRGHIWTKNPLHILAWIANRLTGWHDPAEDAVGWLPPLNEATTVWAAQRIAALKPDLILANYFNTSPVFDCLDPKVPTALIVHDVMALRAEAFQAAGTPLDIRASAIEEEITAFRKADICLAIKQEEADYIVSVAPDTNVVVVPFTMVVPPFRVIPTPQPRAIFVGSQNQPNIDALIWLLETVWPQVRAGCPDAELRIIGKIAQVVEGPLPDGVQLAGFVDDLADEYAAARVALAPIRIGSGMKIKLVEALAHGVPVIATSAGAEGVVESPAELVRVADEADAYAAAMIEALTKSNDASRHAARDFAERHYGVAALGHRLREALVRIEF